MGRGQRIRNNYFIKQNISFSSFWLKLFSFLNFNGSTIVFLCFAQPSAFPNNFPHFAYINFPLNSEIISRLLRSLCPIGNTFSRISKNLSLPDQPHSMLSIHQNILIFENEKIWQPSGLALGLESTRLGFRLECGMKQINKIIARHY